MDFKIEFHAGFRFCVFFCFKLNWYKYALKFKKNPLRHGFSNENISLFCLFSKNLDAKIVEETEMEIFCNFMQFQIP